MLDQPTFDSLLQKLEWQSLSIDLLPHPNMFLADSAPSPSSKGKSKKKQSGARRVFFGGERLVDNITGEAHVSTQRSCCVNLPALGLWAKRTN